MSANVIRSAACRGMRAAAFYKVHIAVEADAFHAVPTLDSDAVKLP